MGLAKLIESINSDKKRKALIACIFSAIAGTAIFVFIEWTNGFYYTYSNLNELFFDIVLSFIVFYLITLKSKNREGDIHAQSAGTWMTKFKFTTVAFIVMPILGLWLFYSNEGSAGDFITVPSLCLGIGLILDYLWNKNIHPLLKITLSAALSFIWYVIVLLIGLNFGFIDLNLPIG